MTWHERAACGLPPDHDDPRKWYETWFPATNHRGRLATPSARSRDQQARAVCRGCPVATACLDDALGAEAGLGWSSRFGIRGGLGPQERARLDPAAAREPAALTARRRESA